MNRFKRHLPVLAMIVLIGCSTGVVVSVDGLAHKEKMQRGAALHQRRCSECHALKDTAALPEAEIVRVVAKYGKKAGLTRNERKLVEYYLLQTHGGGSGGTYGDHEKVVKNQ